VAGLSLTATSDTERFEFQTDTLGQYDVELPAGVYTVSLDVPSTMRVWGGRRSVRVPARGCAEGHFALAVNGQVSGRVVTTEGNPAIRTSISLVADIVPIPDEDDRAPTFSTGTNAQGEFTIDGLPAGRYHLVVNAHHGPTRDAPYPITYWPRTLDRRDAPVIALDEGEQRTGLQVVVPSLAATRLTGAVEIEGRPVAEATVQVAVRYDPKRAVDRGVTDASGAFTLQVYPGFAYVLSGFVRTASGMRRGELEIGVDGPTDDVMLVLDRR
jgi:hypothetical protein